MYTVEGGSCVVPTLAMRRRSQPASCGVRSTCFKWRTLLSGCMPQHSFDRFCTHCSALLAARVQAFTRQLRPRVDHETTYAPAAPLRTCSFMAGDPLQH